MRRYILSLFFLFSYFLSFSQPTILSNPQDVLNACIYSDTIFVVSAKASAGTLTYQWEYSPNGIDWFTVTEGGIIGTSTVLSGATDDTLRVSNILQDISGYWFRCQVSDDNGLTTSGAAKLTVDTIKPVISLSFNVDTLYVDTNCIAIVPDYTSGVTVTDNCNVTKIYQVPKAGDTVVTDSIVLITAIDNAGNSETDTIFVILMDTIAPELEVIPMSRYEPHYIYLDSTGSKRFYPDEFVVSAKDNCAIADTVFFVEGQELQYGYVDCENEGNVDSGYVRLKDTAGNYTQVFGYIETKDTIRPSATIIAPETNPDTIYMGCSDSCKYIRAIDYVTDLWDNCAISQVAFIRLQYIGWYLVWVPYDSIQVCCPAGLNSYFLRVMDSAGNSTVYKVYIYVCDTCPPQVDAATSADVYLDSSGFGYVRFDDVIYSYSDNCDQDVEISNFDSTFYCQDLGKQVIYPRFTDDCGNVTEVPISIYVYDTIVPSIVCRDTTVIVNQNGVYIADSLLDPDVWDNCDYVLTNDYNNSSTLSGESFSPGSYQITWTVTDADGNQVQCVQNLIVTLPSSILGISSNLIKIYPNPVIDKLHIEMPIYYPQAKLLIYDISGRLIMSKELHFKQEVIDVAILSPGIYTIKVKIGSNIGVFRLIKR